MIKFPISEILTIAIDWILKELNLWLPANNTNIIGRWEFTTPELASDNTSIEIQSKITIYIKKQFGRRIYGNATMDYSDQNKVQHYTVSGHIRESFVMLCFLTNSGQSGGYQTYLMQILDNDKMHGYLSFFGQKEQKIRSIKCVLDKQH